MGFIRKLPTNPNKLRERAVRMRARGKSSKEIGAVLGVSPTTVAAWLAHATRGTYTAD